MRFSVSKSTLNGIVNVSGAKNSALKLLTASILTDKDIFLPKFPVKLLDVEIHFGMLKALGKSLDFYGDSCVKIVEETGLQNELLWEERSIRNTLLILGCLLTRTGYGKVPLPGGCKLGDRKYDIHIDVFKAMGADVWEEGDYLFAKAQHGLNGTDIHLPMRSTGATENAILCGTLAKGFTTVWNPHIRPEIIDLVDMLNDMGAKINVYGQQRIVIEGVNQLGGCEHQVVPDNMEALTWLIGAVITNGDVEIRNFPYEHLEVPLIYLRESGAKFYRNGNDMIVRGGDSYPIDISTGPYPGINSDMQPLFAVFGANAKGVSTIIDLRFPGRYKYAEEMSKMGLRFSIDNDMLKIFGGNKLYGADVVAVDLRAGIALLMAGLIAEKNTVISDSWQILRGYENIPDKLKSLNANIDFLD